MFWIGKTIGPQEITEKCADKATIGGEDEELLETTIPQQSRLGSKINVSLSPIEVVILAQLRSRELRNKGAEIGQYGYEMMQSLNELFVGAWEAKSGTIYPILSKLASQKDMLFGTRKKSPLGPVKIVYQLTENGRKTIDQVIQENLASDLEFVYKYFNLLTPFVQNIADGVDADEIFEKLAALPAKGAILAMEQAVTEVDMVIRRKRLEILQAKLLDVLKNLEIELNKT
jgi:DNA-binding PadR family transcriptional regulator